MQFLILARVAQGVSIEQVLPHVKAEAEAVWKQYSAGILRSVYYIADMSGAVLLCEAPDLEAMQNIAAQFPMAKAGVLKFEILPLKPYTGLESLFAKS
jgi:muconolactone delta-isomerase